MRSTLCGFNDGPDRSGSDLLVEYGPTLIVDIGFDETNKPGDPAPKLAMKSVHALVDTGATASCIDSDLAMALSLPIVDQALVSGISGGKTVNVHLAHIFVPSLSYVMYGQFAAVDLAAGGQPHVALIGRTFLSRFRMMYDGPTGSVMIWDDQPGEQPKLL